MAGMFGIGAGWANVPVLNQIMGVPLKISAATSVFILAITDSSAAWVFITKGAELPLVTVPAVLGMMLGTKFGVKLLAIAKPQVIKIVVIVFLSLAGIMSLLKGFGIIQ